MRAAVYLRMSKDRTGMSAGVDRQRADCARLLADRGWTHAGEFVDNDESAYRGRRRPAFAQLLVAVERGEVDAVAAWHVDRLWRSALEQQTTLALCRDSGVHAIVTPQGEWDPASGDDAMVIGIHGLVAEKASADTSRRARRAHRALAEAGRPHGGGKRAYGYNIERSELIEDEAALVREAAARLLDGETAASIAASWNARGIRGAASGSWRANNLTQMLRSPHVAGLRVHDGVQRPATWPAILDVEQWRRLHAVLTEPGRAVRRGGRVALLNGGPARCGLCGAALKTGFRDRDHRIYLCRRAPGEDGCGRLAVLAEPVEAEVRDRLVARLDGEGLATALRARADAGVDTRELVEDLDADSARLTELRDALADGDLDVASFVHARHRLEARLEETRRALARTQRTAALAELPSGAEALRSAWDSRPLDWRRSLVAAVIAEVTIAPVRVRGRSVFDPERVGIAWLA